jgi:uncharacterized protein HemX
VPESPAEPAQTADAQPEPPRAAARSASFGRVAAFMLLFLVALALAGVGAWRLLWEPLQAQLAQYVSRQDEQAREVEALRAWQGMASEDLAGFESRLHALAQRVDQLGPERLADWSLAEADHLLRSAERAARFDYDPARAALALELASATLAPLPGSYELRRAIDGARVALGELRVPDLGVLGGELARAGRALQAAGLREPGTAPSPASATGWQGAVQQAWQQLSEVIVVQRVGTPVQPLLRPHETQYLHEQLALKLIAAEMALRQRDGEAWRRDLADLNDWAVAYLDTGAPDTAAALATLTRLAGVDLRPPLPDLAGLSEQLDALRRRRAADRMP